MNWFMQALKRTFTYRGRARRAEFGWFNLMLILINLALIIVAAILFMLGKASSSETVQSASEVVGVILIAINYLLNIITNFTQLSLATRRLHDLGYSGWWQLAVYFGLPLLVVLSAGLNLPDIVVGFTAIFCVFIFFAYICMLFFKDGQRFENKYGKDPKTEKAEPIIQNGQNQPDTMPFITNRTENEQKPLIEDNNKPKVTFSHIVKK